MIQIVRMNVTLNSLSSRSLAAKVVRSKLTVVVVDDSITHSFTRSDTKFRRNNFVYQIPLKRITRRQTVISHRQVFELDFKSQFS